MRALYAAVLAGALVAVAACSPDSEPAPVTPSPAPSSATPEAPTASIRTAWQASDVRVRPDSVGAKAPWVWEYSDDVVVLGPRGMVALDRATGVEVWRLPLDAPVCGATPTASEVGLVAVAVGRCGPAASGAAASRRTTLKTVDLESASVVWEQSVSGVPRLEIGGESLLVVDGCASRRIDLSSGAPLGGLGIACSDSVLAGDGVAIVAAADAPGEWRVIDVESGSTVASVRGPAGLSDPRRILTVDPLTVLAGAGRDDHLVVARVGDDDVRVLNQVPSTALDAFAAPRGDSLVLASHAWPGATEFSLDDGSVVGEFPGVGAARWIPFAVYGDGVLGFEGTPRRLRAGHGRLTLRSLNDDSVTRLGVLGGAGFRGETDLAAAAPQAVVIGDHLLLPGRGNSRVLAYRLNAGG